MNETNPAFGRWAGNGFAHELVLVAAHDAPGSAPGKRPLETGWQTKAVTPDDLARWAGAPGANVGLRTKLFPAVDVDVDDEAVAALVERTVVGVLGSTPSRRRSNSPRRLLLFRLGGEPFPKAVLSFRLPDGRDAKVEILADGQQAVVAGTHASGVPLAWAPDEPVADDLPAMDRAERDDVLERIRMELEQAGCSASPAPAASAPERPTPATADLPVSASRTAADLHRSRRRANGYASEMPAAFSGQEGQRATFGALCRIAEVSLTPEIFDAAADAYNARCSPPWSGAEWEHKKSEAQRLHPLGEKFDDEPAAIASEAGIPPAQRFTDLGNAQRFVAAARGRFLHVHAWRSWMFFDGRRWVRDGAKATHELAARVARGLFSLAATAKDFAESEEISKHALRSQRAQAVDAIVRLASSALPDLKADPSGFDQSPDLLNVFNGTLDLRTGKLRPHDPQDLITKLVPVAYDPDATAPTWERFLAEVLPDEETRAFVQRAVGYAATGHVREHALFFLHGKGRNGKGTFSHAVMEVLGDYADVAPSGLLLASRSERHPTDIVDLKGKRLVGAAETGEGSAWNEERVKWLTGGDGLKGRGMHENWGASFSPTHKIFVESNYRPRVQGVDEGIWARIKEVPFHRQWREPTDDAPERVHLPVQDPRLGEKLRAERPGILAWIAAGARAWYELGLGTPREVREATASYRRREDVVGEFLGAAPVAGPVLLKDLYQRYVAFAVTNEEPPVSARKLREDLERRGYTARPSNKGLVVRPPNSSPVEIARAA